MHLHSQAKQRACAISIIQIAFIKMLFYVSVQLLSRVWPFTTPWTEACQASLSITNSRSLLKLMSKLVMPSNHLILCHPLLPRSIFPSIRVFSNESALLMRWPEYWSFSFSISPSNEHPGLISFRMDWLDILAVQGTLKSLLQHHSSKASILHCWAFFIVQHIFYVCQLLLLSPPNKAAWAPVCSLILLMTLRARRPCLFPTISCSLMVLLILAVCSHVSVALVRVICLFSLCCFIL